MPVRTFRGYRRRDRGVGIRNEIWIIPTVGCVNGVAQALARAVETYARGGWTAYTPGPTLMAAPRSGRTRRLPGASSAD
ncbi:MAG: UxaA family hydrolase [Intestinimonas sp.]